MSFSLYTINNRSLQQLAGQIDRYSFWFFALLMFTIPFGHLGFDPVLVFWFILRSVLFLIRPELSLKRMRTFLLLPVLFFIIQLTGLWQTENAQRAYTHLFTNITFLILPLVYPLSDKRYWLKTKEFSGIFTLGVVAATVFCLGRALALSLGFENGQIVFNPVLPNGWEHRFTTGAFSFFTHPSYFAMFSVFAMVFLGFYGSEIMKRYHIPVVWYIVAMLLLTTAILLLQSRAGFLAMIILFVLLTIRFALKRKWFLLGTLAGALLIAGSLYMLQSAYRFKQFKDFVQYSFSQKTLDQAYTYRAGTRIVLWKVSGQLIREHWLWGVGPGDVKDAMAAKYRELGLEEAAEKRLNAHNQYLQSWLENGVLGFIALMAMLLLPFIQSIKKRDYLALSFLVIVSFHLLFESMFNRMDAIGFFVPMYALLLTNIGRTPSAYPSRSEG